MRYGVHRDPARSGRRGVARRAHRHLAVSRQYNHVQPGFEPEEVAALLRDAGLTVDHCSVTTRERRAPHFEVVTAYARRPAVGETSR